MQIQIQMSKQKYESEFVVGKTSKTSANTYNYINKYEIKYKYKCKLATKSTSRKLWWEKRGHIVQRSTKDHRPCPQHLHHYQYLISKLASHNIKANLLANLG